DSLPRDAAIDILLRRPGRRVAGAPASFALSRLDEAAVLDAVRSLDDSYLVLQGPPGTGKTTYAAHAILSLLQERKRIGVLAPSHKVAHNLLDRLGRLAVERGRAFCGLHKASSEQSRYLPAPGAGEFVENVKENDVFGGEYELFSGTAWLFAKAPPRTLDYLFVDEAGQLPLASVLAAARAARNVVLLGDPQQLAQISKTVHPAGIGRSALEYLLGGEATVGDRQGILLDLTYRMQRDVCAFVSQISYRGLLHEDAACNRQSVRSAGLSGAGLRFLPVEHDGNRTASMQEAERIAREIGLLFEGTLTDREGRERAIRPDDVIVVTPYNGQRRLLARIIAQRTGAHVDVGTVNKFQGREAHVVFYSMATSSGEEMPRSADFLFERNRLNVAISRARAMAVVVASPELLRAQTPSIETMRLLNALDRFVELAQGCGVASQTSPFSV
ncbi:MAG TPA: DEAD/DEAH box helicase, partial [Verrucomicrobiae bacterium]|nr:DEAD/DEAH box helicase [Verrucomicrobiae bacterium]